MKKLIVITGASSGFGKATAIQLSSLGQIGRASCRERV